MKPNVRRARAGEAPLLSALALRSKAHWGYDAAFMTKVAPSFIISEEYLIGSPLYVLELAGTIIGFYGFRMVGSDPFLSDLWLEPAHIGKGFGGTLMRHAIETAAREGYRYFLIESDPNAEAFYLRMGAERTGSIRSADSGRMLPLLRLTLP
jgi:GNAT superfamily N-acetyltransferase